MKEYITTGIIDLFCGRVGLDENQAARRRACLATVPDTPGVYEIKAPVQFKAGEIITLDPDKVTFAHLALTKKGRDQEQAEIKQGKKSRLRSAPKPKKKGPKAPVKKAAKKAVKKS